MRRYWEIETDHEGLVPVRAGCGASGRSERATRAGSANGQRERAARVDGAGARRERAVLEGGAEAMVCRWDGIGKFRPQVPLGRLGDWGMAPRPYPGAWGGRMVAWVAIL